MAVGSTPIGRCRRAWWRREIVSSSMRSSSVEALLVVGGRLETPRVIVGLRESMVRSRECETHGVRGLPMRGEVRGGDGYGGRWGRRPALRSSAMRDLRGGESMLHACAYEPERPSALGAKASRLS
jgi:hypothetical protein